MVFGFVDVSILIIFFIRERLGNNDNLNVLYERLINTVVIGMEMNIYEYYREESIGFSK